MGAIDTTATLTKEMQTYYEKVFLARAEFPQILSEGSQKRSQSQNNGKVLRFTRYDPLTIQEAALTEGSNPPVSGITESNVDVTLAEYGLTLEVSRFLSLTSIDVNNREKIALMGQNMGESLNRLVRTQLELGTAQIAGGATLSSIAASDVLSASEIKKAVRTLEVNKAIKYDDGYFMGKAQPYTKADLLGDSTWINAKTYSDVKGLYKGEMGELYQVRWLLNIDGYSTTGAAGTSSSAVAVYHNYIHGKEAFGTYDLSGDQPKLYIVPGTSIDSGNPAGRKGSISWAGSYAAKILNSNWALVLKTGATA